MANYKIKDPTLARQGNLQIEWASAHMPVLNLIKRQFEKEKPLKNRTISACIHVTKETAVLMQTFAAAGADVALCGCNPLSTQDDVAAALVDGGIKVYAWRGETTDEYYWCINKVIDQNPQITLDDGADLVSAIHIKRKEALKDIKGGTEETTTGIMRLRAMEKAGALKYPIIAVNDAYTKHLFDNRYGTGQSTIDGIVRATNILLAGKNFIVAGYGWCGKGLAMRARGMGGKVTVTEVDPVRALEAVMDGFNVTSMSKASEIGDIFVTTTGNINVIRREHMQKMKDNAILANSGHFNVEISIPDLEAMSVSKRTIRRNLEEYKLKDGKKLYLLGEGRLINLAAAEGHPSEVMDMSFANQALCAKYIAEKDKIKPKIYKVPKEIDHLVANLKLKAMEIEVDRLTEEQKKYIATWETGTT